MNQRGDFDVARKSIYWLIAGIVITAIILAFAMVLSVFQVKQTEIPPQFRAEIISLRFLNTPECFTYQDPLTNRVYLGVIDLQKFTQARMDQCYRTETEKGYKDYNFALQLAGFNPLKKGQEDMLRSNNFFNKVDFTLYKSVLVRSGDKLIASRLTIYVQTKI